MLIRDYIREMMVETASLLGRSLDAYWPVNIGTLNDLPERNLSMHFAHTALKRNFHIFAEIKNHEKEKEERLDILCIGPDKQYYIACEFKTYVYHSMEKSYHVNESKNDILRVSSFPLNRSLPEEIFGDDFTDSVNTCNTRLGIVAGVLWRNEGDPIKLDSVGQRRFKQNVEQLGGIVEDQPILVKRYKPTAKSPVSNHWFGAYYLYYALIGEQSFQVDRTGCLISGHISKPILNSASLSKEKTADKPKTTSADSPSPKTHTTVPSSTPSGIKFGSTGKVIMRTYKDACYGEGINGTLSKCNTSKSDKSRLWYATFDANDKPIWLCSHCGCQWSRKEKKK